MLSSPVLRLVCQAPGEQVCGRFQHRDLTRCLSPDILRLLLPPNLRSLKSALPEDTHRLAASMCPATSATAVLFQHATWQHATVGQPAFYRVRGKVGITHYTVNLEILSKGDIFTAGETDGF